MTLDLDTTNKEPAVLTGRYLHELSWAERNGFPYWLLALTWLVLSFVLFQLAGSAIVVGYFFWISDDAIPAFDASLFSDHLNIIFLGNSISQILFLGLLTWLIAGLSATGSRMRFMRFRTDSRTGVVIGLTFGLMLVVQPLVWGLSWLNAQLPFPDSYMAFEETQMDMIKYFLTADHVVLITLIHVGLVPSICEEVLYRGYILRSLEKSWGIWVAILVSGILFGLYHIRLTQVIPLALIGMLLAWIVWRSDSIFPAMAGHFVNNGGSVLIASLYPHYVLEQMSALELPPLWLLLLSLAGTIMLLRYIYKTTRQE